MSGRALDFMTHRQWLESPRWAEVRREAIVRAGGRCVLCNSSMGLQGHHRTYSTLGTPDEAEDVFPLCEACHELVSERLGQVLQGAEGSEKFGLEVDTR